MSTLYVTKSDSAFFPGVTALTRSLRLFDADADIAVLDCGLENDQVRFLRDEQCRVIPLELAHSSRPATVEGTHYNDSIYALMHIHQLDADRFIHLDADTVVFPPFAEVIARLTQAEFVGVPDHPALTIGDNVGDEAEHQLVRSLFALRRSLASEAVNAGVFACRMSTFRTLRDVMESAYASPLELPRRDQTLLNIALAVVDPPTARLDVRFNFRHHFRRAPEYRMSQVDVVDGLLQPFAEGPIGVMHYVGPDKPWMPHFDRTSDEYKVWAQFTT